MKRSELHHYLYIACLLTLAISIPLSNYVLSMGGIFLVANWFLEWNWKEKWERLKNNLSSLILASFFFMCALFLLNTENMQAGIASILNKLPFLYTPIIMATSKPLEGKYQRLLLNGFILGVFIGTVASVYHLLTHQVINIREISVFISHIRFSLCIVLAICFSSMIAIEVKIYPTWLRRSYILLAIWFLVYLFIAQTLTGIVILFLILLYLVFYVSKEKKIRYYQWIRLAVLVALLSFSGYTFYLVYDYFHIDEKKYEHLEEKTALGNPYEHDLNSMIENGSLIGVYVCKKELHEAWATRSGEPYDNYLEATLIRYLNSKGLRKDMEAVMELTDKDIQYIEQNIANVDYTNNIGVKRALYPILFGYSVYKRTGETVHSTLFQRFSLWKASIAVIKDHFWFGVGIGDQKIAIDEQLEIINSPLKKNMGAHSQFLTYWLMGGIVLLLSFVFIFFYPFFFSKKSRSLIYRIFFIVIFLSLFAEDTLETQIGITLYVFLNSFFLYLFSKEEIQNDGVILTNKR